MTWKSLPQRDTWTFKLLLTNQLCYPFIIYESLISYGCTVNQPQLIGFFPKQFHLHFLWFLHDYFLDTNNSHPKFAIDIQSCLKILVLIGSTTWIKSIILPPYSLITWNFITPHLWILSNYHLITNPHSP